MRKKALIIEENDNLRHLLSSFLGKEFEALAVRSGFEAMICLHGGFIPDVIVNGKGISPTEGLQFLSNLTCSGMFGSIPVVVIGNPETEEEEQRFRQSGAVDYFRKPFNPVALQNRMFQLIG
ncbi:MAG: response regulator [Saprospiraceae bacterium]